MKHYATNPYNILVPVHETEEFLLYNTFSGGIELLNSSEGRLMSELMTIKKFDPKEYNEHKSIIDYLLQKDYVLHDTKFIEKSEEIYLENKRNEKASGIYLTIGTTIVCNMACSYCFEFVKPNNTLKDEKIIAQVKEYISQIIAKEDGIKQFSVTWYGGEPLVNMQAIKKLSPHFMKVSEEYGISYNTDLITNGIYLTPKNVKILRENGIHQAQVTLDGAREVHNKYRPLKTKGKNYFKILENLSLLPEDFSINLRINIDRTVAATLDTLLQDLEDYNIWPQRYRNFKFSPAWLRTYDGEVITEEDKKKRLNVDEFFDIYQDFRLKQVDLFNKWSVGNGKRNAKLAWELPQYQSDCPTWAAPYGLVIDPLGNIHKCWETIHDDQRAATNVFQDYKPEHFEKYTSFNRFDVNEVCRNCTYLPVCDQISCAHQAVNNNKPQCTYWKYKTEDFIKEQYLRMRNKPDTIHLPTNMVAVNTGHTNK